MVREADKLGPEVKAPTPKMSAGYSYFVFVSHSWVVVCELYICVKMCVNVSIQRSVTVSSVNTGSHLHLLKSVFVVYIKHISGQNKNKLLASVRIFPLVMAVCGY